MKTKQTLVALAAFLTVSIPAVAIEGLTISVDCPNVVLGWPSDPNSGETFIVQYRATLNTNDAWQTLTNFYPAFTETNWTTFVHSNQVTCNTNYSGGGTNIGGDGPPSPGSFSSGAFSKFSRESYPPLPPLPPLPWEPGSISKAHNQFAASGFETSEADGAGDALETGFYRVVRNGAHIVGLTNDMNLSGQLTFQVEVGNDDGELQYVTVTDNGESFEGAEQITPPFNGPLSFQIDTTRMTNGSHVLQVEAFLITSNSQPGSADAMLSLKSEAISVNVYNEISFPYWEPQYIEEYDWLLVQSQSAHPDTDWQIDIYDDADNYIASMLSHTTNGTIAALWDLHDADGVKRTNDSFQFVVSTGWTGDGGLPPSGGSGGTAAALSPPAYKGHDNWPAYGDWVVANQLGFHGQSTINLMVDDIVLAAESHYYDVYPSPVAGEAFRIHTSSGSPSNDWATLKMAITNFSSRNFYYFGHGSPNAIGGYTNSAAGNSGGYSENGLGLTSGEIQLALQNFTFGHFQSTNQHHYRFVYIDGCESASGRLPGAFAIGNTRAPDLTYYPPGGARPSAFVGFTGTPWIATAGSLFTDHVNYVGYFFFEWGVNGKSLEDARKDAQQLHNNETSLFLLHDFSKLKIKGYKKLLFDEGNFQ